MDTRLAGLGIICYVFEDTDKLGGQYTLVIRRVEEQRMAVLDLGQLC